MRNKKLLVFPLAVLLILTLATIKRYEIQPFPYVPNVRPMSGDAFMAWVCSDHLNPCAPGVKVMEVRNVHDLEMCVHESAPRECVFTVSGNYVMNSELVELGLVPTSLEDCDRALFQCFEGSRPF